MKQDYIKEYLSNYSWRKKENANTNESFSNLSNYISSKVFASDFLNALPPRYRKAHMDAQIHIHNLEAGGYIPYCCGHNLKNLLLFGMKTPSINSRPAKHFNSVVDHVMNWLYCCYDDKTEVLTNNGWKLFENLDEKDIVATFSRRTKSLEFQKPIKIHKFDYNGDIMIWNSKRISIAVTPNHNMLTTGPQMERFALRKAENLKYAHVPIASSWEGKKYDSITIGKKVFDFNDFCEFMGFYLSEGWFDSNPTSHHYRYGIAQSKIEVRNRIENLLKRMNINFYKGKHQFEMFSKDMWIYLSQFGKSIDKYIPSDIKCSNRDSLKIFIESYFLGDGSLTGNNRHFYTISKRLADDVQEVLLKIGKSSSIRKYRRKTSEGYTIIERNTKTYHLRKGKRTQYSGKVYCCTVPNNTLLVRRNNIPVFSGNSQMEFAGAQSFGDFDTLIAPFIKKDKLSYKEVKQQIQKLIFNLNFTMRSSSQTPFTNLTLNYTCPKFLENEHAIIAGLPEDFTYGDCLLEIEMIDQAFTEIMNERDMSGKPFTFPILTINLNGRFPWQSEVTKIMAKNCASIGSYYFMNYLGSGISEDTIRSMCCRLNIDMSKFSGPKGMWNTSDGTGSLGVVTINLPNLAYQCKTSNNFFEELDKRLEIAVQILKIRKERIKKYMKLMMPFNYMNGWSMKNYYMTIGIIGLNEMVLNMLGTPIMENMKFVEEVIVYIRKWIEKKQEETKDLINLEMVPGEGCSYRLAFVDRKLNKDIKTLGGKDPYYSTLLVPPVYGVDVIDRIQLEQEILPMFTGGTIFRTFIGEKEPSEEAILSFVKTVSSSKIPYFDLTSTYSICSSDSKTYRGSVEKCPSCGSSTEIYSRVVGYYRPVSKWNIGKQQEFKDRKYESIEP